MHVGCLILPQRPNPAHLPDTCTAGGTGEAEPGPGGAVGRGLPAGGGSAAPHLPARPAALPVAGPPAPCRPLSARQVAGCTSALPPAAAAAPAALRRPQRRRAGRPWRSSSICSPAAGSRSQRGRSPCTAGPPAWRQHWRRYCKWQPQQPPQQRQQPARRLQRQVGCRQQRRSGKRAACHWQFGRCDAAPGAAAAAASAPLSRCSAGCRPQPAGLVRMVPKRSMSCLCMCLDVLSAALVDDSETGGPTRATHVPLHGRCISGELGGDVGSCRPGPPPRGSHLERDHAR